MNDYAIISESFGLKQAKKGFAVAGVLIILADSTDVVGI